MRAEEVLHLLEETGLGFEPVVELEGAGGAGGVWGAG